MDLFNTDFNGCVFPLVGANGPHNRQKIDPLTPRTRLFTESMETCDVEEMGEREFSSEERKKKQKTFHWQQNMNEKAASTSDRLAQHGQKKKKKKNLQLICLLAKVSN